MNSARVRHAVEKWLLGRGRKTNDTKLANYPSSPSKAGREDEFFIGIIYKYTIFQVFQTRAI